MDLTKIEHDFNEEQQESLQDYIKNGKPGLVSVKDTDIFKWNELYMSAKSYEEIAKITNSKRDLILYMSAKGNWCSKRLAYYENIADNMREKLKQTKLNSINTVSSAVNGLGKYFDEKFNKFISTKDKSIIENIDTKLLAQYYKSMEVLEKIVGEAANRGGDSGTNVNINVGSSATVEQVDDQTIEITDDTAGDILKYLAGKKKAAREEE